VHAPLPAGRLPEEGRLNPQVIEEGLVHELTALGDHSVVGDLGLVHHPAHQQHVDPEARHEDVAVRLDGQLQIVAEETRVGDRQVWVAPIVDKVGTFLAPGHPLEGVDAMGSSGPWLELGGIREVAEVAHAHRRGVAEGHQLQVEATIIEKVMITIPASWPFGASLRAPPAAVAFSISSLKLRKLCGPNLKVARLAAVA
jgi:hypothetical protein